MLGNGVKYRGILACKSVTHHLANMDDTFYSEILSFYTASEYKYPAYIYNTLLNQRPDVKSKFRQRVKPYKVEDGIVMHGKEQVLTIREISTVYLRPAKTTQSSVVILVATKRTRRYLNDITGKVC